MAGFERLSVSVKSCGTKSKCKMDFRLGSQQRAARSTSWSFREVLSNAVWFREDTEVTIFFAPPRESDK
jgi:hypothetical protein